MINDDDAHIEWSGTVNTEHDEYVARKNIVERLWMPWIVSQATNSTKNDI